MFHTEQTCETGLDIGIVLDKSLSLGNKNLRRVLAFLQDLIKKFNPAPEADHFGFITFHSQANMVFTFANKKYHDKGALLKKIASEPIKLQRWTRTDLALAMARDKLFTTAGGDRPDKANVMIVVTDGRPIGPNRRFNFQKFLENIAKDFKVSFVKESTTDDNLGTYSQSSIDIRVSSGHGETKLTVSLGASH